LFRPFGGGGHLDQRLLQLAAVRTLEQGGYTVVLWNAVPHDWDDVDGWVGTAMAQCRSQPWTQIVVHDLPTGAMAHLDRFLGEALDAGARLRQDYCPDCVVMRRGTASQSLHQYVATLQDDHTMATEGSVEDR
jgi:hypothetical protein